MAGLLNAPQEKTIDSPILAQIQKGVEAKVAGPLRKFYMSLTVAGMSVMFSDSTGKRIMQKLKDSQNIVADVSAGVANVMAMIFNEVSRSAPKEDIDKIAAACMPASIHLMCQALDAWEKISGQQVTDEIAAQCASATTKAVMAKFKITPDKVKQVVAQARQQQPAARPQPGG